MNEFFITRSRNHELPRQNKTPPAICERKKSLDLKFSRSFPFIVELFSPPRKSTYYPHAVGRRTYVNVSRTRAFIWRISICNFSPFQFGIHRGHLSSKQWVFFHPPLRRGRFSEIVSAARCVSRPPERISICFPGGVSRPATPMFMLACHEYRRRLRGAFFGRGLAQESKNSGTVIRRNAREKRVARVLRRAGIVCR